MQQVECQISGNVQGVFLRAYIKECADVLDIVGFVENLSNGMVHMVAQAPAKDTLETLMRQVREGSPLAQIESVDTQWGHPDEIHEHFTIRQTTDSVDA